MNGTVKKISFIAGCFVLVALVFFALTNSVFQSDEVLKLLGKRERPLPEEQSSKITIENKSRWRRFLVDSLAQKSTLQGKRQVVNRFKESLRKVPDHLKYSFVISELSSGADFSLSSSFSVGKEGELREMPTYRVFLLDLLAELDSDEAVRQSKNIFKISNSPDEWAVAMRNYAWGVQNSRSDPYLKQQTALLVENQEWAQYPTAGFLEAFDFIPYTRNSTLVPLLLEYTLRSPHQSLRHAAFLALDRLVIEHKEETLWQLLNWPRHLSGYLSFRGNFFARLDLSQPEEQNIFQTYLAQFSSRTEELSIFEKLFPLQSEIVSNSLATSPTISSLNEKKEKDKRMLYYIEKLIQEEKPHKGVLRSLLQLQKRLQELVRSGEIS